MSTFVDRHRSDFNFNNNGSLGSFGDILWRDHAGHNVLWLMNNNTAGIIAPLPAVPPDWHVKAAADFDSVGSGNADILWQNDNGAVVLWQMNAHTVSAIRSLPNPGPAWHVVGDNNFDSGSSSADILFRNDNGSLAIWTMVDDGGGVPTVAGTFAGIQNPGPTWHVVGTGDTHGLGVAGILWQHDNGALALWEDPALFNVPSAGSFFTFTTVAALPAVDASWQVKGMQDVNDDGRADIIFQNDNGAVVVWQMGGAAGTTIEFTNLVNLNPGPSWHIVGLRDMDNDARIDILFQNDNGAAAVWEDYTNLGGGSATFNTVLSINPNANPNGDIWDLL